MSDIVLRDARPGEEPAVLQVILAAYSEFGEGVPDGLWEMFSTDAADFAGRAPYSDLIVAERDGTLLGTVTLFRDGSTYDAAWPAEWTAVRLLSVAPEARRLGLGRSLMEECIRRTVAAGATAIGLHTTPFMLAAQHLYAAMGFERRPDLDTAYGPNLTVMGFVRHLPAAPRTPA